MANELEAILELNFPVLHGLLGDQLEARAEELARLGVAPIAQVGRDLQVLSRRTSERKISRAYRDLLRNPGYFIRAMYEIRVATMLAPVADRLELAPPVGNGACELHVRIGDQEIFIEATAREDRFPPAYDLEVYTRETVERSFRPGPEPVTERHDSVPASVELRQRIATELEQLPCGEATVVVLGSVGGQLIDMQAALWGDEVECARGQEWTSERVANGLFAIDDDVGGTSRLSAAVWLRLVPDFQDIRVHGRLFVNPRAAVPLLPSAVVLLERVFDPRATLLKELDRIRTILVTRYGSERIILFGSLARELDDLSTDTVHQWSDIDLFVVKRTNVRFVERVCEVLDLVRSTVGLNVLVYTPEELVAAEREGNFFVKDEILKKGRVLFP